MKDMFFFDGEAYFIEESHLKEYIKQRGFKSLKEAYKKGAYYWTEWDVEEEVESGENYFDENGNEYTPDGVLLNDLFEHYDELPEEVRDILNAFNEAKEENYEDCAKLVEDLEKIGYTCEYYLDATLFNLKKL